MTAGGIQFGAKIFFTHTQDLDGELWLYGMALMNRDAVDWDALIDAMETAWTDNVGGLTEKSHLVKVAYSEWDTVSFTGWHQRRAKAVNHAGGSGNMLPPQNAVVATLLNVDETGIPIRSRRGRVYFGMVPATFLDANGALTSTGHDGYATAMQGFQDAANSVPASSSGDIVTDGLCVASPTNSQIYNAQDYGIGLAIDTQRRRRQKRTEGIVYTAFT